MTESGSENGQKMTEPGSEHGLTWVGQLQHVHASEIPHKIVEILEKLHKQILGQWRQYITGDPDK